MRDIIPIITILYCCISHITTDTTGTIHKVQRCAGELFNINCPLNHLIYIEESTVHYRHPQDVRANCDFTNTTCQENFSEHTYRYCATHNICSQKIGVQADDTVLCRGGRHYANHIEILYRCISVAAITDVCSISRVSLGEGFIASPRFPSSIPARRSECHCTIRSESIFYIHLIEAKLKAFDNNCVEQLSFGEKRFCPNTSRGYYPNERMRIDKESSITFIRKVDGGTSTGKFWLKYKAYSNAGEVTIDCNHNKTSTDIGDRIRDERGTACKQKNLTISCNSNELIYIHTAEKASRNSTASISQCPTGRSLCKLGYYQPILQDCASKDKCHIHIGNNNQSIDCNSKKYPANVINIQYKCAPASRLLNVCNKMTTVLSEGFITSPGYPSAIEAEDLDCMCTVDTEDSSQSLVVLRLIEAYLMGDGSRCMEELTVGDIRYCSTNSRSSHYYQDKTYSSPVRVHFKAKGSNLNDHGKFWMRFYAYGQPLKVTCGPTPQSFYTTPFQSTTIGRTFHEESSTMSSSTTSVPSTESSTITTKLTTVIRQSSSLTNTENHPHVARTVSPDMTTLTYKNSNTPSLQHKTSAAHSEGTSSVKPTDSTITPYSNTRTKVAKRTTYKHTQRTASTTLKGATTFNAVDLTVTSTTRTPSAGPVRSTRSSGSPITSAETTSTQFSGLDNSVPNNTPVVQGTDQSQMALVGGLIGAAAALVMITVGLIILLMYLLKKKRGKYHMKPERQSELPDKYTYT